MSDFRTGCLISIGNDPTIYEIDSTQQHGNIIAARIRPFSTPTQVSSEPTGQSDWTNQPESGVTNV